MSDSLGKDVDSGFFEGLSKDDIQRRQKTIAQKYSENFDLATKNSVIGSEIIADKIIKRAKEAHLPVHDDPELLSLLIQLNFDNQVPDQVYTALGEMMTWVKRFNVSPEEVNANETDAN